MDVAQLATEALTLEQELQLGWIEWDDVIKWADYWIMQLEIIQYDLIEISLSWNHIKEGDEIFRRLAEAGNGRQAFLMLLPF